MKWKHLLVVTVRKMCAFMLVLVVQSSRVVLRVSRQLISPQLRCLLSTTMIRMVYVVG
ncbi:unnamed protein product [Gongylonema pulchrum]|uniref:Secreted protein n=1 Tax=Gongylonema pulchrum TaxID=637853 RepID=A0A183EZR0_9BILA|nr:unnamed protein product [Gongylonema pulchrum]